MGKKSKAKKTVDVVPVPAHSLDAIKEFAHANRHLLVMVANPLTDEIFVGFNDVNSFVKFPTTGDIKNNVVFGVLRASKFESSIDDLITGLMKVLEDDEGKGVQLYKVVGGALLSIAEARKVGGEEDILAGAK